MGRDLDGCLLELWFGGLAGPVVIATHRGDHKEWPCRMVISVNLDAIWLPVIVHSAALQATNIPAQD